MNDDARDLANTLNGELQGLWQKHGLHMESSPAIQDFRAGMVDALVSAARDPAGFLAQHHPHHRKQAASRPSSAEGSAASVDGWADAFGRARGDVPDKAA